MIDNKLYFNSKEIDTGKSYDLTNPAQRLEYFHDKLGKQIIELSDFFEHNSFLCFLIAQKGAGKGTYAKMFQEVFGETKVGHLAVGDLVRDVHSLLSGEASGGPIKKYLKENYRGFNTLDNEIAAFMGYRQDMLISTEFILTLVKMELEKYDKRSVFIDGLPRNIDQISFSLFFRDLFNYSSRPDFFIILETPESLLAERIGNRLICPLCNTSKNYKLNPSKFVVKSDGIEGKFDLLCDNDSCKGYSKQILVEKKGDVHGIESIRERIDATSLLMEKAKNLVGVPVIVIPGTVNKSLANTYFDDFELNPEYSYKLEDENVIFQKKPWEVEGDDGSKQIVLMAATVVLTMIKRVHEILI